MTSSRTKIDRNNNKDDDDDDADGDSECARLARRALAALGGERRCVRLLLAGRPLLAGAPRDSSRHATPRAPTNARQPTTRAVCAP